MARFLSEEWFALVRAALPAAEEAAGAEPIMVRHRVTGGPDGDVDYVVRAGIGVFSIGQGGDDPVDVEITETYETAAAISQSQITPSAAFAAGQLKLAGDVALLADRQDDFAALGQLLAPVRAATTY